MKRRNFIEIFGLSAFAVSSSGFNLIKQDGTIVTDQPTSSDMLGPFFREHAPYRKDLRYPAKTNDISINVIGKIFGTNPDVGLSNLELDVWHCDLGKNYDMDSEEYRCRGKLKTDEKGNYEFKTFVPPPYGGRPKHIHYLVHPVDGYQQLVTQLYFKGDSRIKANNWIKYPWDEKRILKVYKNDADMAEIRLDLYLTPIS